MVLLRGHSNAGPKGGKVRCLSGEQTRLQREGRWGLGLRLNNEDKSGKVPRFEEVDMPRESVHM